MRSINSNIVFLIKSFLLSKACIAKNVFKEEIAKCWVSGNPSVVKYLEREGYLSQEELEAIEVDISFKF